MDLDRFYLDYNSTSPLSQSVLNWLKSGDFIYANPASQHNFGKQAKKVLNQVQEKLLAVFSRPTMVDKVFFHSGASEAISTFAYSFSEWAKHTNRKLLICYSNLDHPAVLSLHEKKWDQHVLFHQLEMNQDFSYNDSKNFTAISHLKKDHPDLLILYHHLWVHNEVGSVSSLAPLKKFKFINDLYIHVDAVQAPGKILDWMELEQGDIFTFSAHKFGALKATGFSFYSSEISVFPFITGGGQQAMRSGTENVLGVKSIALALEDLGQIDFQQNIDFKKKLLSLLRSELHGIGEIISDRGPQSNSNTIYFYLNQLSSDVALALFDLSGLMISAGSACSSGAARPSRVLKHLGLEAVAKNGLRISLPFHLSLDEYEKIEERMISILNKIRTTSFL